MSSDKTLLEERSRLRIVSLLATSPGSEMSFTRLRDKSGLTGGNLSSHLRILEHGGLVDQHKEFQGRKPLTTIRLTEQGRQALEDAIAEMERIIAAYRQG